MGHRPCWWKWWGWGIRGAGAKATKAVDGEGAEGNTLVVNEGSDWVPDEFVACRRSGSSVVGENISTRMMVTLIAK